MEADRGGPAKSPACPESSLYSAVTMPFGTIDGPALNDRMLRTLNDRMLRTLRKPCRDVLEHSHWELYPTLIGTEFERQACHVMERRVPVIFE